MTQQLPVQWRKGDVVLVLFPSTDADARVQTKRRPALIISGNRFNDFFDDVLVVPLTTSKPSKVPNDVSIQILLSSMFMNLNSEKRCAM